MESEQVDPHGSILCMGPPLASAATAVLPIARLGRTLFLCLPRAHGARPERAAVFCPSRRPAGRVAVFCAPGDLHVAPPSPVEASPGRPGGRASAPPVLRRGPALQPPCRGPALLPPPLRPCPAAAPAAALPCVGVVNGNEVLAPPSLGQRRRLGRMYGSSGRPSTVGELLDRLRRAAGDRCGVAVDQGARQLQLTGLGDGWAVDQEGQFDREVDGAVRRPEK
ncbi:unnamed protein product [Closterium sp. NIES-53]